MIDHTPFQVGVYDHRLSYDQIGGQARLTVTVYIPSAQFSLVAQRFVLEQMVEVAHDLFLAPGHMPMEVLDTRVMLSGPGQGKIEVKLRATLLLGRSEEPPPGVFELGGLQ